jgi:hypothetical protein
LDQEARICQRRLISLSSEQFTSCWDSKKKRKIIISAQKTEINSLWFVKLVWAGCEVGPKLLKWGLLKHLFLVIEGHFAIALAWVTMKNQLDTK